MNNHCRRGYNIDCIGCEFYIAGTCKEGDQFMILQQSTYQCYKCNKKMTRANRLTRDITVHLCGKCLSDIVINGSAFEDLV